MSRKTKQLLWEDRLRPISECPGEIFDKFDPSDEFFQTVEIAEGKDCNAVREITSLLFDIYKGEEELNPALIYFAKMGLSLGIKECALILLECISRFNVRFDLFDEALAIINAEETDDHTDTLITKIKVKRLIASAGPEADYALLTDTLSEMYDEYSAYARIYLAHRRLADTGSYDTEKISALAVALDVPRIISLPTFLGDGRESDSIPSANTVKECAALKYALGLIDMDEWRDFWLRAIYEYAEAYLDGSLFPFTDEMILAIGDRAYYPEKKIHILAIKKYCLDLMGSGKREYASLEEECRFERLEFDLSTEEERDRVIREAVYTDSVKKREERSFELKLGTVIPHTKNRYLLTSTLKNHFKRGNRHMWDITVSIATDSNEPPEFRTAKIRERLREVTRGGVKREAERKLSQVWCAGEIVFGEKRHPFELDLIIDISYVSSTKCEWCDIRIRDYRRNGNYLTIDGVVAIH